MKWVLVVCMVVGIGAYNAARASHIMETICTSEEEPLEFWVNQPYMLDTIITGKVVERRARFGSSQGSDACWVRLTNVETLRGTRNDKEMWVSVMVNLRHFHDLEKFKALGYCPFEEGKKYVIYGRFIKATAGSRNPTKKQLIALSKRPAFYIFTASDIEGDGFHCPPHSLTSDNLISKIKSILSKKGK